MEHFDVTFLIDRSLSTREDLYKCLQCELHLQEGENKDVFKGWNIVLSHVDDEDMNFANLTVSIENLILRKNTFEVDLRSIQHIIECCFLNVPGVKYALCIYELSWYILDGIKDLNDISDILLRRFPIVFKRDEITGKEIRILNPEAQDLFSVM